MTRHDHDEQRNRVAASVACTHHPDVYPRRELPSPETQAAAHTLTLALGRLEQARDEFEAAREAFRAVLDAEDRS